MVSRGFAREKATEQKDLPHKFSSQGEVCSVCQTGAQDARHQAWERENLLEREAAAASFARETGS